MDVIHINSDANVNSDFECFLLFVLSAFKKNEMPVFITAWLCYNAAQLSYDSSVCKSI